MTRTTLFAAVAACGFAVSASAGNMAEPVMEPTIVIADTQASSDSSGLAQWFIAAAIIAAIGLNN